MLKYKQLTEKIKNNNEEKIVKSPKRLIISLKISEHSWKLNTLLRI